MRKMSTIDEKLDYIFELFDDLLLKNKFKECDDIINDIKIDEITIDELIAVLTITSLYSKNLKSRVKFYTKVEKIVRKQYHKESEEILKGLK